MDKATAKRQARADKARARVRDRRRFKVSPPADGKVKVTAPVTASGTLFPGTVLPAPDDPLRDGADQVKLGGDVLVGRLRGARIFHLALEERATCPRSCQHWTTCYTNGMPFMKRWRHGPELERALRRQVAALTATGPILVRLHSSGDFYSADYVRLWLRLLERHAGLNVFGFTAYRVGTPIGDLIREGRRTFGRRWAIRHSASARRWGSFTIDFPTERKLLGDALVCPEQRHANDGTGKPVHCGSCGACWETDRCIVFVEH